MRNILMTVMLLAVVAVLFINIVSRNGGIQDQIQSHGTNAISRIGALSP